MTGSEKVPRMFLGLDVAVPAEINQPLEVAMVIKGMDKDGRIGYWAAQTPTLGVLEHVGMMRWCEKELLADDITVVVEDTDDDEDDDDDE